LSLRIALEIMRKEFVLNNNYLIPGEKRLRRTKKDLKRYLNPKIEFLIIDFDKVRSLHDQNKIIEFFKEKDYYVGIIPSRSWDGRSSFNLKGIIKAKGLNNRASINKILQEINKELFPYCKIDFSSTREGSYQAPSLSYEPILIQKGQFIPNVKLQSIEPNVLNLTFDEKVVEICIEEYRLRGFEPTNVNEERGLITFRHPSEVTPNGYFMFISNPFYMNHFNVDKSFSIFNEIKRNKVVQDFFEAKNAKERAEEFSGVGRYVKKVEINERFITINDDMRELLEEWVSEGGLMKVKSAMGTGKSTIIDESIRIAKGFNQKVLFITNRISVAKDFQKKYDIKLYSDGSYEIGDDLIVQYDSLWKYSLKHFDLVILDEYVSIILHSRNSLGEFGNMNKVKLMYAMRTKPCLLADAFLFGLEDSLIKTKPKYLIENKYREDIAVYKYPDIGTILEQLKDTVTQGNKVSISCTSKNMAKALSTLCEDFGVKTVVLSADTLDVDKELIYESFSKNNHNFWDVLIYTPTLTVGISILNDIDHHFHIDESMSADVISSLQMIRRSRKAENIHYFIQPRKRYLETKIDVLNKEVRDNIEKYFKNSNSLLIDVDQYGDFKISELGIFVNEVEIMYNKFESNHENSFEILLEHQLEKGGTLVPKVKTSININDIKRKNKAQETQTMKKVLESLDETDYNDFTMEEFQNKKFISGDKEKIQKLMSEIKKMLRSSVSSTDLKKITELEISKGYKFISKLRKLKFFLSKSESDIEDLLSFVVSENSVNRDQIQYFNYLAKLKKNNIKLKNKITMNEAKEVDQKIGWGDFKSFLKKIGYNKRGSVYLLPNDYIKYSKLLR